MSRIAASELITNTRGAVYHLDCRPEEIASTIITVGDPDRVKAVSRYFDKIEFQNQHREFVTHTGFIGKKRITVVSTGIGPDNIDIVLNELDALVNINLEERTVNTDKISLDIIRIGTSGSLQEYIPVDHFVASTHGLGLDNLLHFYQLPNNDEELQLIQAFRTHLPQRAEQSYPYITGAAMRLLKHFVDGFHHGITVTCPGFYGPQGRVLRMGLSQPHLIDQLSGFQLGPHRISNFEMETSALYGMSRILGHHCVSLSAIVANRITKTFSSDSQKAIEKLINNTLQQLTSSSQ